MCSDGHSAIYAENGLKLDVAGKNCALPLFLSPCWGHGVCWQCDREQRPALWIAAHIWDIPYHVLTHMHILLTQLVQMLPMRFEVLGASFL